MKQLFESLRDGLFGFGLSVLTFFAPSAGILLVVLGFVVLDIITAYFRINRQRKKGLKVKWTSRSFIRGFVPKLIGYTSLILLFYMMDVFLLNEFIIYFIPIHYLSTKIISLGLIYAELKSIDENWNVMFGKGLLKYIMDLINFGKQIKKNLTEFNDEKYKENDKKNDEE
jgi:hypothetical protein